MKSIEQIKESFICPICKSDKYLAFGLESATCTKCDNSYDLGTHKFD